MVSRQVYSTEVGKSPLMPPSEDLQKSATSTYLTRGECILKRLK